MSERKTGLDEAALTKVSGGRPDGPVYPTNGDDGLDGDGWANRMAGLGGNDHMYAHGGNDSMSGGQGVDRMEGGGGGDLLAGGIGGDQVNGGIGSDTILWSPGEGSDAVNGGDGVDTLRIEGGDLSLQQVLDAIEVPAGAPAPYVENGAIVLGGGSGSLTIGGERVSFSGLERITLQAERTYLYGR